MQFIVHNIQSPILRPYIEFILFNFSNDPNYQKQVQSFANTNFCLGIIKDKQMYNVNDQTFCLQKKKGINSYITGIYLKPFRMLSAGEQDEICVNFTPLGVSHFFSFPMKTFILGEDILTEAFGKKALSCMEIIFEEPSLEKRGIMLEEFLLRQLQKPKNNSLDNCIYLINKSPVIYNVEQLSSVANYSVKKIYRLFSDNFDISPKNYLRVMRFRSTLAQLKKKSTPLTSVAYANGFYDQSHFILDFKFFTEHSPRKIINNFEVVDQKVWLTIF